MNNSRINLISKILFLNRLISSYELNVAEPSYIKSEILDKLETMSRKEIKQHFLQLLELNNTITYLAS